MSLTNVVNQAGTPNLVIPARSLPVGQSAVVALSVCYAASTDRRPCGTASTTFVVSASPLTAALSGANAVVGAREDREPALLSCGRR